jgi:DNA mismatch repair ATPase MutS
VKITSALEELIAEYSNDPRTTHLLEKYLRPLHDIDSKFDLYRELIEHVIDMDRLPEVVISSKHDPELTELNDERMEIESSAKQLQETANQSWGSFTDVKLESNAQWGFIFRTTKGDDERELRLKNSKVQILSLQKVSRYLTLALTLCLSFDVSFSLS